MHTCPPMGDRLPGAPKIFFEKVLTNQNLCAIMSLSIEGNKKETDTDELRCF